MNDVERLFDIFFRLQAGEYLSKKQLAFDYHVSEKTAQRDFSLLTYILECHSHQGISLAYHQATHQRYLQKDNRFGKQDILVLIKILLESRSLNRNETQKLIDSLLNLLDKEGQKEVRQIVNSEWLNYSGPYSQVDKIETIWLLSTAIREQKVLTIRYRLPEATKVKTYDALPISIFFDLFYFYVIVYHLKYEEYITLRVDRIQQLSYSSVKVPKLEYGNRYRDGDVRPFKVDASEGEMIRMRLEFSSYLDVVFDQFPKAKLVKKEGNRALFEIECQWTWGLEKWLRGQGTHLKILAPQKLRDSFACELEKMRSYYQ